MRWVEGGKVKASSKGRNKSNEINRRLECRRMTEDRA